MPEVTVVITSHDSGPFLERATRSALAQTVHDIELLVVDDGSRDPQPRIVDLDPRIRFIPQSHRGVSVARNVGVSLASADFVAFLDHDDEWMPDKLEMQLADARRVPDAAFWCTRFEWYRDGEAMLSDAEAPSYHGLLSTQTVLLSSALIRRRDSVAVGGHDPWLTQMEDWEFFLRLASSGRVPVMNPRPLVRYHLHGSNASRDFRAAARARFEILDRHDHRARGRRDGAARAAISRGRRRTRELFAYQAVDAARALGARHPFGMASNLGFAARMSPRVAGRAIVGAARTRFDRHLGSSVAGPEAE